MKFFLEIKVSFFVTKSWSFLSMVMLELFYKKPGTDVSFGFWYCNILHLQANIPVHEFIANVQI